MGPITETVTEEQDRFFLRQAYHFALRHSHDARTHNAAVLVDPATASMVAWGTNAIPTGVHDHPERRASPAKYQFFEHAERAAIFAAARQGFKTEGLTMYAPWFACTDCARAIIAAGIREVVGHADPCGHIGPWTESIERGLLLFREAGVSYRYVAGPLGVEGVRFDGHTLRR